MELKYTEGMASEQDVYCHLMNCSEHFIPRLSETVNLQEYSRKIYERAVTFEAWSGDKLVGLVGAYFNDSDGEAGYITSVSTLGAYSGKGIASILINGCIDHASRNGFKTVLLEVAKANTRAMELYEQFRFQQFEDKHATMLMKLDVQPRQNT